MIEIRNGGQPQAENIRVETFDGVLLPWWDPRGREMDAAWIGKIVAAFHTRFGESLLVQYYTDQRERGRVRFVMIPSVTPMSDKQHETSTSKITEMSYFIAGFLAASEEHR